jgi:hypothetical protein
MRSYLLSVLLTNCEAAALTFASLQGERQARDAGDGRLALAGRTCAANGRADPLHEEET